MDNVTVGLKYNKWKVGNCSDRWFGLIQIKNTTTQQQNVWYKLRKALIIRTRMPVNSSQSLSIIKGYNRKEHYLSSLLIEPNGCGMSRRRRPANHPFSQSVDWIAKSAAQRGRTEGAVLPVRRSAAEHDPYVTSEYSTTARWIRLGVNVEVMLRSTETRSTYSICSRGGRRDWCPLPQPDYLWSTTQGIYGHPSRYQPRPTGLNFGDRLEPVFPFGDSRAHVGSSNVICFCSFACAVAAAIDTSQRNEKCQWLAVW